MVRVADEADAGNPASLGRVVKPTALFLVLVLVLVTVVVPPSSSSRRGRRDDGGSTRKPPPPPPLRVDRKGTRPPITTNPADDPADPSDDAQQAPAATPQPTAPPLAPFSIQKNSTVHLPDADVKAALADVMLVLSMSPARYRLAPLVREHYAAFFTHMIFIGPVGDRNTSVEIHEHDTFYGNGQYRAMASVIRQVEVTAAAAGLAGYLYLADDLVLQPWTLVGLNKTVPWASMIGVGNVGGKMLRTTPSAGMAVERETRKSHWAQWRKNRPRLLAILDSPFGVERLQPTLAKAFQRTPRFVRRSTGWRKERRATESELKYFVFFTIADTYYVPRSIALPFAEVCDAMAAKIVHGELAIPTALQALSDTYEALSVQYYWASPSTATDCPRYRWNPDAVGIHRCIHDHPFAEAIYNATSRRRLLEDEAYRVSMLRMPYPSR